MITLYKTTTLIDAALHVADAVRRVNKNAVDVMHTVIVPDRASLEAEKQILQTIGGSFNVQVRTFSRLAQDVLPKYNYLSKQSGILALSTIIQRVKGSLTCFRHGVDSAGFVADMYDVICSLKYCKITPEKLTSTQLPKGLSSKTHDVALLYKEYLDFTKDRFVDSADKLDLLCQNLAKSPIVTEGYFYLYDFDNLSAQEFAIVEQLATCSKGVTVACCATDKPDDRFLYLGDIFAGVMKICKERDLPVNVVTNNEYGEENSVAEHLCKYLFRYGDRPAKESGGFVEIVESDTRFDEVYSLACRIQRYVRDGGRFGDVYVVTSDVQKYCDLISTVFPQFGINYFCDRRYCLADHPYARFVADYMTCCNGNGKLEYVLPVVKNPLFDNADLLHADDDVFLFENFCLKYNVSYDYSCFRLGKSEPYFAKANAFRAKFNSLFSSVQFAKRASAKEYVAKIRELIVAAKLNDKNDALTEAQRNFKGADASDTRYSALVSAQVPQKFESVLSQAESILGDRVFALEDFIKALNATTASVNVSVIPVTNDCVVFANMAKSLKHDVKFLALLGANRGEMPIVKKNVKLLSDENITALQACGINFEPKVSTENKRERFSLFQLVQEPSKLLYVSYTVSGEGEKLTPSPLVADLCKIFIENNLPLTPKKAEKAIFTEAQALEELIAGKRKLLDEKPVDLREYTLLDEIFDGKTQEYIFAKDGRKIEVNRGGELYFKNSATSVSQLTDFFKCPYKFYVEYGLNVKPRTVAELKAADLGNILHAVLELYVKDFSVDESDEITTDKAQALFDQIMQDDFYKGLADDAKMSGILKNLKAESERMCIVVKNQLKNSDFTNLATELAFGGADADVPAVEIPFDGGKFSLVGKIDRVDKCDDKFVVIDYKSGAKASEYAEKSLYDGQKMQLLVYAKAVQDHFGLVPVGFYYFNLHDDFASYDEKKVFFYNGRTTNDVEILKKLDTVLNTSDESEKLGVKLKKDGTPDNRVGKRLTQQQIYNQIGYAEKLISKAGELMRSGYAAVNPYEGTCKYCDYKDLCCMGDVYTYRQRNIKQRITADTIDRTVTENDENE